MHERLHLVPLKVVGRGTRGPLEWNSEDALTEREVLRVPRRDESKEHVERGQSHVPCRDAVPSLMLEAVKEREDNFGGKVLDAKSGDVDLESLAGELKIHLEGVSIAHHGVATYFSLGDQVLAKERVEMITEGVTCIHA
jgi:hypothetical protein